MAGLGTAVKLLESYRGRDKVMRTTSFAALFASGMTSNPELAQRFAKITMELSGCRTILRLFDDLSMLALSMRYGWGKNERDTVQRVFKIMSNFVNQMFFPIEHVAWAAEKGLISISAAPWWLASLCAWVSSLLINLVSIMWRVLKLIKARSQKGSNRMDPKLFKTNLKTEALNFVENVSNLGMAVHWLPGQQLWCGRLNPATVGLLGMTSSLIGLAKMAV
ncbi:peroxisomal membrane protein 11C [Ciona intestinalis]